MYFSEECNFLKNTKLYSYRHGVFLTAEKMERVEVKIRVTRRQLQELLEKAGKGQQLEKALAELMTSGKVCYQQEMWGHWRPSLQSIPEADESS